MLPSYIENEVVKVRSGRPLTLMQKNFLDTLYDTDFDFDKAWKLSNYKTPLGRLLEDLNDEIIEIARMMLVKEAPKSVKAITDIRDAEEFTPNANTKLAAATTILDRIGLGKREKIEVENRVSGGLFIIPAKDPRIVNE
jgi:hypothetical protein